jgi:general secretion pathway protein F
MPVFRYKGVAAGNRMVSATIDAESVRAARALLRAEGIYPTEIAEGRTRAPGAEALAQLKLPALRRVPDLELALFSGQLATLLTAGVPLVQALSALTEQVEHERLRSVVGRVREAVNQGSSLADALSSHPHVFDQLYCSMVQSGESSGALDLVLGRLSSYVEGRMELRNKLINAMVYPALMLAASLAVVGLLLVYVIPNVTTLLRDLNQELPLITRIVVGVSQVITASWFYLGLGLCAALVLFNRAIQTARGRRVWDGVKLRLPVVGRLVRFVSISRFARTLATLVGGGLNIVSALDISRRVAGNVVIGAAIDTARNAITKGSSLAGTLRQSGEFPPLVTHMISVGEASGELDGMLTRVADTYDKLVDNTLQRLTALLGPILLIFVAVVILVIILSTLLPLLSLTSAL